MKSQLVLTLALLFFFPKVLCSQDFAYPKGAYMSFGELMQKSPSQQYKLTVYAKSSGENIFDGNIYRIESADGSLKKNFIKSNFWAVSDGTNLFINCQQYNLFSWFAKAEHIGENILYRSGVSEKESMNASLDWGAIGGTIAASKRFVYSINTTSGRFQRLDKIELEHRLQNYPDLAEQYKREPKPNNVETIFKYAIQIN